MEDPALFLPVVLPTLVQRLGSAPPTPSTDTTGRPGDFTDINVYQPPVVESSEEVRLLGVLLLDAAVARCTVDERIVPFCPDLVAMLHRTLADGYPEVRKVACAIKVI
jgi:hypothetical protein